MSLAMLLQPFLISSFVLEHLSSPYIMGRPPCCDESGVKKGPWTPEEDEKLMAYISKNGEGSWRTLPKHASLNRCGKSCRLRWANYLRPHIRRGKFTEEEERMIVNLHSVLGNKWSKIAAHLPGRTDNEIKNFWNTHIRKKLLQMGIDPETHKPRTDINHLLNLSQLLGISNLGNSMVGPWSNPLISLQLLQNMLQIMNSNSLVNLRNPYLLANQSLNPLDAFLRGTNTLQNEEPILRGQEYLNPRNPGHFSQANGDSSQQDIFKSWTDKESPNPEFLGCNKSSSTSHENQAENLLPALVASYPRTRTRTFNQMESSSKPAMSTQSPASTTFEDWEKFLVDDETGVSYWKEILDLASTSASPISW